MIKVDINNIDIKDIEKKVIAELHCLIAEAAIKAKETVTIVIKGDIK